MQLSGLGPNFGGRFGVEGVMKAAVYSRYGGPEVVRIAEVEKPAPGDDEVLIEVRAASVNAVDWHLMRGEPYPLRAAIGLRKPKTGRLGFGAFQN